MDILGELRNFEPNRINYFEINSITIANLNNSFDFEEINLFHSNYSYYLRR